MTIVLFYMKKNNNPRIIEMLWNVTKLFWHWFNKIIEENIIQKTLNHIYHIYLRALHYAPFKLNISQVYGTKTWPSWCHILARQRKDFNRAQNNDLLLSIIPSTLSQKQPIPEVKQLNGLKLLNLVNPCTQKKLNTIFC